MEKHTRQFTTEEITYIKYGYCEHKNLVETEIPNCNIILTNCKVCDKEFDRQHTKDWVDKQIPEALGETGLIDRSLLLA